MLLEMTWIQTGTIITLIAMLCVLGFAMGCLVLDRLTSGGTSGPGLGHGVPPPPIPPATKNDR